MIPVFKSRLVLLAAGLCVGLSGCQHAKLAKENRSGGNLTGTGTGHGYGDGTSTGADYATLDKAADSTSEQRNHDEAPNGQDTTLKSGRKAARPLP